MNGIHTSMEYSEELCWLLLVRSRTSIILEMAQRRPMGHACLSAFCVRMAFGQPLGVLCGQGCPVEEIVFASISVFGALLCSRLVGSGA